MHRPPFHPTVRFVAVLMLVTAWVVPCAAQTEIDVFMERVLDRREENWITLRQYVLDEREVFEVRGPDRVPLQSMHREYMWYVRDGYLIRSPVRLNGVTVGDRERREYEENWLRQERRRSVGQQRQPQAFSRRSAYDNVTTAIERMWGTSVGRELSREITEDARLWRDGLAAIVSATDRILAYLGGVGKVGFGQAVERTRDGYVMLETGRLDHVEVARLMTELIPELAGAVPTATVDELDGFHELVELAVTFEVSLPEVAGALEQAHATVASRGLSDRASDLDEARTSLARVTERRADADPTRDPGAPTSAVADSLPASLQPRFVSEAFFSRLRVRARQLLLRRSRGVRGPGRRADRVLPGAAVRQGRTGTPTATAIRRPRPASTRPVSSRCGSTPRSIRSSNSPSTTSGSSSCRCGGSCGSTTYRRRW